MYNIIFEKVLVFEGPSITRFTDFTDFKRVTNLWKGISNHPNILSMLYIEIINGHPYKNIEYIPNNNLDELIR